VFDLDFDIVLQEAVKVLDAEDFGALLKSVLTLKQVQDEEKAKAATGSAAAGGEK
jgi:hypothetical protein